MTQHRPPWSRLLVTGGAGRVAALLRPQLAGAGRTLRLLDIRTPDDLTDGEEPVIASVDDIEAMTRACAGVDAVLHLGGYAGEVAGAEDMLRVNGYGTWCVLEAARRNGVSRVVLASSNHAVGFTDIRDAPPDGLPADIPFRPDTLYGWSKVAMEGAGQLYADRYGMDVICLRIGQWSAVPAHLGTLAMWLSAGDGVRLVEASLGPDATGFRQIWGISRNSTRWCSLAEGEAIGFFPQYDSEVHRARGLAATGGSAVADDPVRYRVGGEWCTTPLGGTGA